MVAAPWRKLAQVARWNGQAPQVTTGLARVSAALNLNGTDLNGRPMTVNEARPREERGGGGGGGGGGFRRGGGGGGGGGGRGRSSGYGSRG